MSFVLDNSVAMRWLLGGKPADIKYAAHVLVMLKTVPATVPSVWFLETSNMTAKAESKQVVSEAQSQVFISLLNSLNIVADNMTTQFALTDTLQLARRYKLSAYDAAYLELALRLKLPIATLDSDLAKAAKKAGVKQFL